MKNITLLAFEGVGLESADDKDWFVRLTDREIGAAAKHGCYSERDYPDWIDDLAASYPDIVLPIIQQQIRFEWTAPHDSVSSFLQRYGDGRVPVPSEIQTLLVAVFLKHDPPSLHRLDLGIRVLRRLDLTNAQRKRLVRANRTRYCDCRDGARHEWALRYLAILLLLDINAAVDDLSEWLQRTVSDEAGRVNDTFSVLFGEHDPLVAGVWPSANVMTLERLLTLSYSYVNPEHDIVHEGAYTPNARDHAERARNTILSALMDRPGAEAYRAMVRVQSLSAFSTRVHRFRELARFKAEQDSESPPWTEREVAEFAKRCAAPVKSGPDLMRVTLSILGDVGFSLQHGDVTSRPLLQRAKDEDEVQNWLVEQVNFRSRERCRAFREPEVARGKKPDVIVASTSAPCEVAIEVKHCGKHWTVRQLEDALKRQLAERYLLSDKRRHGVFVVTNHQRKQWRVAASGRKLEFDELVDHLNTLAASLVTNSAGAIEVRCVGIDATAPDMQ